VQPDGKNQRRYPPMLCLLQRLEDNVQMSLPLDLRYGDIQCSLTEVRPGCETRFPDNGAEPMVAPQAIGVRP
jgi:hypothetical protein